MTAEKSRLIEDNMALARSLTKRYIGKGIEYDDLFQSACLGLSKAANNFDESRGLKFSTYAVPVMLGELRQLFRNDGTIKVTRSLKELAIKARRVSDEYFLEKSCAPKVSELAKLLNESEERVKDALCAIEPTVSIDDRFDAQYSCSSSFEDEFIDIFSLRSAVRDLTAEEARLLTERYVKNKTQQMTAVKLGMTQVQVSRREKKILLKLRELIVEKE